MEVINPQSIVFSGTAGQVRNAFHTEIHNLNVNGEKHIANMSNPQIPAALAPAVVGVVSLNDFKPRPANRPRAAYTPGNGTFPVVPADLATIYNFSPAFGQGYTGTGQTIVVIEDSDIYTSSDWYSFRSCLGTSGQLSLGFLPAAASRSPTGAYDCFDPGAIPGVEVEAAIDAEWASAAAPNATIEVASCADTTTNFGGFVALENLLNASSAPPAIVSISYSDSEPTLGAAFNAYINALYQQGASEGVSIFVSAGDSGAAASDQDESSAIDGISVSGFASTPYNVAVGGTDFSDAFAGTTSAYWSSTNSSAYGSALSYIPEIPWNDSCAGGLIATYRGYPASYGASGLCNSVAPSSPLLTTGAGSGGPSGCATGAPSAPNIVGGTCAGYAKPYWQSLVGNPHDGVRDLPDVSLLSADGFWGHYFVVCWSDLNRGGSFLPGRACHLAGIWRHLVCRAHHGRDPGSRESENRRAPRQSQSRLLRSGRERIWQRRQRLLQLDARQRRGRLLLFYDVTQGDMDVDCIGSVNCYTPSGAIGVLSTSNSAYQPTFKATLGWDFATGIGTVNAYNLVENWPQTGITAVSGAPQTAVISSTFAAPLVAKITDGSGNPVVGATVTFRAPATGASATFAGGTNTAVTNSSGMATSAGSLCQRNHGNVYRDRHRARYRRDSKFLADQHFEHAGQRYRRQRLAAKRNDRHRILLAPDRAGKRCQRRPHEQYRRCLCSLLQRQRVRDFRGGTSSVTTNALGQASVSVDANGNAGVYSVTASVALVTTPASFTLSNTLTAPWSASGASGSGQSAAIATTFAAPFSVTVVDSEWPSCERHVREVFYQWIARAERQFPQRRNFGSGDHRLHWQGHSGCLHGKLDGRILAVFAVRARMKSRITS